MSSNPKKAIYLDNAAATPIDKAVKDEMFEFSNFFYGNPSSFNEKGREARDRIEKARAFVAKFIGARPDEVIFTSSGSEANNLAILGSLGSDQPGEAVVMSIEHPSVLEAYKVLRDRGWKISHIKVDENGLISLEDLESKLSARVKSVSVMYANNEIGTIEPIKKISKVISNFRNKKIFPLLHVDACQATEYLGMNVNNLGVDLMTFNGSKIYGPRGIGVLYARRGVKINPQIVGGDQEGGRRAGTENAPAIVGMAKALSLIDRKEGERLSRLRDYFIENIQKVIPGIKINGALGKNRLPNNINISISGLSSEILLLELDKYGIYAGSGSACTARSVEPSHVLRAIGNESKYLEGALRFSLGRGTNKNDLNYVFKILPQIVLNLKKRLQYRI